MTEPAVQHPSVLVVPAPQLDIHDAARLAGELYRLTGTVERLRSERDANFLVTSDEGLRYVLKVSNSAEPAEIVDLENQGMRHMATHEPALPIPTVIPTYSGELVAEHRAEDGRTHLVRMLSMISGTAADHVELKAGFAEELGRTCALAARGLRGFDHPAAVRPIEWDPRHVHTLSGRLNSLAESSERDLVSQILDRCADLPERTANLPTQVAHCDVTLSNVLTDDGRGITGLIDFGDMHRNVRVADLAIALASLVRGRSDVWATTAQFLQGYQRVTPLERDEILALGDLLTARLAATVLITSSRTPADSSYTHTSDSMLSGSWQALRYFLADGPDGMTDKLLRASGLRWNAPREIDALGERREAVFGHGLVPLFYRQPLAMVRGEGAWMWDTEGRRYLDAYNNVPVIGHGHPAVAQSVGRQIATLNVNIRYLHPNSVELAERLLRTMPPELDTCIFVNSGSEANDLAWRMALLHTGRTGALVTNSSYHGVSSATAPLSANTWHAGLHPDHVATMPAPPHVAPGVTPVPEQSRARGAEVVHAARTWLGGRSRDLALCLIDPMFTSGGILNADVHYVAGLADEVRAAGGLFLADEVQAGFGRSGVGLWSFERYGITPDFVTLGKPMGNGFPIAALITRSDIAARLTAVDEYFSTFGGTPAAAAAALTVLDVIEAEDLVARSAARGAELRSAIVDALRDDCEVDARGSGLIAGVEITHNGVTPAPNLLETLKVRRILVSNTGPGGRVLKVRPPLIWTDEHIEVMVDGLRDAVRELSQEPIRATTST